MEPFPPPPDGPAPSAEGPAPMQLAPQDAWSTAAPAEPPPPAPAPASAPAKPLTLLRVALLFYGVVTLFAIGYALFSQHAGTLLGEGPPRLQHLLAALGVGLLIVAGTRVAARVWRPFARATEAAGELLGPVSVGAALLLALLSGTAEELLFRGALWPTLGLAGTTLLFGLVHVAPQRALWIYPLFAAACGLLLGLLRDGTGSVVPPMLAHVVVNAFNLVWLGRRSRAAAAGSGGSAPPATPPDPPPPVTTPTPLPPIPPA